jgi:hypothetical protein
MAARIVPLLACACTAFAFAGGLLLAAERRELIAAHTITPSEETRGTLDVAWSVDVSVVPFDLPASPLRAAFALCPDGSVVTWQAPGLLHRVAANGHVAARGAVTDLNQVRSVDCDDTFTLLRVNARNITDVVTVDRQSLQERGRHTVGFPGLFPGAGLRILHGRTWLLGPVADGLMLARFEQATWVERVTVTLPERWRYQPMPAPVGPLPLVQREVDGTFLLVRGDDDLAADYAVIEFDRLGTLRRIWRRASADATTGLLPRGPRVMRGTEVEPIGAALLPDGTLAVHRPHATMRNDGGRLELVDASWQAQGVWTVPQRGTLIGADRTGALYFGDALSTTIRVWKSRPPGI